MSKVSWRWLVWGASLLLLLGLAIAWAQLETIQAGGAFRIFAHLGMAVAMGGLVLAFPKLDEKRSLLLLLSSALLVRLVLWPAPVSDDVNRYLWEGSLLWQGENPYATLADDERWSHLRDQYWENMNHRERMTAYPPGMELVMSAASWMWYDLQVFKVVALIGDFWCIGMLVLLLKERRRPLRWLGFYLFNPLILASFAIEAHLDSLMMGALLTALFFAQRKGWKSMWLWLGFAVQFKFVVIVLLPYFLVRSDWRKSWIFFLVLILPTLFFGKEVWHGLEGLLGFGNTSAFNAGFYEILRLVGASEFWTRKVTTLSFLVVGLFFGLRTLRGQERDLWRLTFLILGALLVCSPIVHFWYLSWIIPFLVLSPSLSWLLLSVTMSTYFLAWHQQQVSGVWGYHRGWVALVWLPCFAVALWEYRFVFKRLRKVPFSEGESVDLVIPVSNAGEGFGDFLDELKLASPEVNQFIVVDGQSQDSSREIAREAGCVVVSAPRGRGGQIAAGIAEASADFVAIIHADTKPRRDWIPNLRALALQEPGSPAFALGQRFDSNLGGLLTVEVLNELRAVFEGSVFGDQTLILRREAIERMKGFPAQPLMEDVEVSWRLLEQGRICYLGEEWTVSAEKWRGRFRSRFLQVVGLMIRYRWVRAKGQEAAAEFSQKLYEEYYPTQKSEKTVEGEDCR